MVVNHVISEMRWRLGNRTDIQSRLSTWLNDAYFELLLSPRFTFYQLDKAYSWTTPGHQRAFFLSTMLPDLWFILNMRNDTYQIKLRRKDPSEFDRTWQVEGIPTRYTRFDDRIELDPTPDMDYDLTIRYRTRPPELQANTESWIDREWDEVITTMAVQKGWEALEQWDKASAQKQLIETQLARRFDAFQMDDADSEATIGVEYGT